MLTVTEPANSTNLTTLAAVLRDLAKEAGTATDLAILAAIQQASATICSWCGRAFAREVVRETFHQTTPANVLLLSRSPVVEVVSVTTEVGAVSSDQIEMDTAGFLYLLDGAGRRCPWPVGRVIAEYSAGYTLPGNSARTLPHDVERAAITLTRSLIQAIGRDPSVKSETVDGVYSADYGLVGLTGSVTGEVETLLAPYRVWGIA